MKTNRQSTGGTLGLAAVLMLVLIMIGFAAFILYKKEGGFREIQTASGCGNRNVAHNAQVHSVGGLSAADPIDRAISEVVTQRGRVSLIDGPVLESWELLAAMNAAADGNPQGKANVRTLLARIHGLTPTSLYSQLGRSLGNFGTTSQGKALFESVARRNPTGLLNDPNSEPMKQTDYRVAYTENRTNVDLGNPNTLNQQRPYTNYFTGERQEWPSNLRVTHGGRDWLRAYAGLTVGAPGDRLTVVGPALPFGQTHNISVATATELSPLPLAALPPNTFINSGTVQDIHGGSAVDTAAAVACSVLRKPNAIAKGFIIYDNSTPAITASAIQARSYVPCGINPTPELYATGDIGVASTDTDELVAFTFPTYSWLMERYKEPGQNPANLPSIVQDVEWWGGPQPVMFDATGRAFSSNQEAYNAIQPKDGLVTICSDINQEQPRCKRLMEPQGPNSDREPPAQVAYFKGGTEPPGPWPDLPGQMHSHDVTNNEAVSYMDAIQLASLAVGDLYALYDRPNEPAILAINYDDRLTTGSLVYGAGANPRLGIPAPFKGDRYDGYFAQVPGLPEHSGKRDYELTDASRTNITTIAQQIEAGPYTVTLGGSRDVEAVSRPLVMGRALTLGTNLYPAANGTLDNGYSGGARVASPRPPSQVIVDLLRQRMWEVDPSATRAHLDNVIASMTGMGKWWIDKRNGTSVEAYPTRTPWSTGTEPEDGTAMTFRTNDYDVTNTANAFEQLRIHDHLFFGEAGGRIVGHQTLTAVPCSGARLLLATVKARTSVWTANPRPITWPPGDPPQPRIVPVELSIRN